MMFVLNIKAQSHDEEWSKLVEQDSVDITSISLYPKNTRTTIFKIFKSRSGKYLEHDKISRSIR